VEAANLLGEALQRGKVTEEELAALEHRRRWPTRVIQMFQAFIQKRIAAPALQHGQPMRLPLFLRLALQLPILRKVPIRLVAFGLQRVRIRMMPGAS
jgi:hypothetical protein